MSPQKANEALQTDNDELMKSRYGTIPLHEVSEANGTCAVPDDSGWSRAWRVVQEKRSHEENRPNPMRRNQWLALVFGQAIALFASSMNASSFTLNYHYGIRTFLFQMVWVYLILSVHMFFKTNEPSNYYLPGTYFYLRVPWWVYLALSFLDVLPNFMTLLSFNFTSLTSTTLLSSLTIPSTMFFSKHILGRVFKLHHVFGVVLCMVGGSLAVWTDLEQGNSSSTRTDHSYIGDLLAVMAALMYCLGDTVAEYSIKHVDRQEYLGMIGLFGFILTVIAVPILERGAVYEMMECSSHLHVAGIMVWYIASVVLYYVAEAKFLVTSDATLLNLSMQTTSVYAMLFAMISYGEYPQETFFVAVAFVVTGVIFYELGASKCGYEDRSPATNDSEDRLTSRLHVQYKPNALI